LRPRRRWVRAAPQPFTGLTVHPIEIASQLFIRSADGRNAVRKDLDQLAGAIGERVEPLRG
jgi:hypothetical protein